MQQQLGRVAGTLPAGMIVLQLVLPHPELAIGVDPVPRPCPSVDQRVVRKLHGRPAFGVSPRNHDTECGQPLSQSPSPAFSGSQIPGEPRPRAAPDTGSNTPPIPRQAPLTRDGRATPSLRDSTKTPV